MDEDSKDSLEQCNPGMQETKVEQAETKQMDAILMPTTDFARTALTSTDIKNYKTENIAETELLNAVLDQQPLSQTPITPDAIAVETTINSKKVQSSVETIEQCFVTNKDDVAGVEAQAESNSLSIQQTVDSPEKQINSLEQKLEQITAALAQKDNMIALYQRENALLEKEKQAFRKEKDLANKEKEATVIKFAMKEKLLIDAKKEKEAIEKQLADSRKEVKNVTTRFQAVNEEKSRITYIIDEKCNEIRKYQRECEKIKTDYSHLESKLKYHMNKLNIETEAKLALEKKLEEERNAPNKLEEKALEKLKVEHEANTILLRHELENKTEQIESLLKDNKKATEQLHDLREQLKYEVSEKNDICRDYETLQNEHTTVQNALSDEILNSAKLRGQLEELQVLRTQNALNEDKIKCLCEKIQTLEETIEFNSQDLQELRTKELELLSTNKEISESLVAIQNEMCLLKAQLKGIEAENVILKKEREDYDAKHEALEQQLQKEIEQKTEERQLLTKHLSEKTKLYETTKLALENLIGDFEATTHKHATVVKELQREIQKYRRLVQQTSNTLNEKQFLGRSTDHTYHFDYQHENINGRSSESASNIPSSDSDCLTQSRPISRNSSSNHSDRPPSELSDTDTIGTQNKNMKGTGTMSSIVTHASDGVKGPTKKHLVERILRLQQASARQTEKIDFLENHTLSLVAELQKKSKVVQYYMLRDQAGALTSTKSDQHKSELTKYGNGVMSAIYGGIKAENKSMTLELSLEINKKLQAVLEDTLLKNITLKENLDVLGLEVDNLTRKLRFLEAKE